MDFRDPLDTFHTIDELCIRDVWEMRVSLINENPVMYIQVKLNLKGDESHDELVRGFLYTYLSFDT